MISLDNSGSGTDCPASSSMKLAEPIRSSGSPEIGRRRLIPIPTATRPTGCSVESPMTTAESPADSHSTPPTFLCPIKRSFGHLRPTPPRLQRSIAIATATPTANGSTPTAPPDPSESKTENQRPPPRGECQRRPSLPRPEVCSSATTVENGGAPCCARTLSLPFVDVRDGCSSSIGIPSSRAQASEPRPGQPGAVWRIGGCEPASSFPVTGDRWRSPPSREKEEGNEPRAR